MGMEIDSKPDVMTFPTPLHPLEMGPKEPPMDMPEVMPESQNVAVAVDDVGTTIYTIEGSKILTKADIGPRLQPS